jgi:hypothetical protein
MLGSSRCYATLSGVVSNEKPVKLGDRLSMECGDLSPLLR